MKKIIFLIAFLVSGIICFAQDYGVIYTFPATTSKAQFYIAKNNDIHITSTNTRYHLLKDIRAGVLISTVIADNTWASRSTTSSSFYVDTLNHQHIYGTKHFYSNMECVRGTGAYNFFANLEAFGANTTGTANIAIGTGALAVNTTGSYNIALGPASLRYAKTSRYNIGIGYQANMMASTGTPIGWGNIGIGAHPLKGITTGYGNIAIGDSSLMATTTGYWNIGIGSFALDANTEGYYNVGIGLDALSGNTTGDNNTAIGGLALQNASTANNNTAIGQGSLLYTTGGNNVGLGVNALAYNTSGTGNVAIGYNAGLYANASNRLIINNKAGGADTALVYGTMGATPKASLLEINAPMKVIRVGAADTAGLGIPANYGIMIYLTNTKKMYCYNGTWNALW